MFPKLYAACIKPAGILGAGIWILGLNLATQAQSIQTAESVRIIEERSTDWERQASRLVQMALHQHPQLIDAACEIRRESGIQIQATRRPNPSAGYTASEVGNEGRSGQQGLYVSQQWITAGKLEMAGQAAQWKVRAATERLQVSRLQLSSLVQSQYWMLVAARHRTSLLSSLEQTLKESVDLNQTLLAAGEISQGSLIQAMLEKNQLSVAVRQAQIDQAAKSQVLSTTLGTPSAWVDSVPSDPWPTDESDFFLPTFDAAAVSRESTTDQGQPSPLYTSQFGSQRWLESPELAELRSLIEAAKWELRLAQVRVVSDVDSFASVQHDAITNNVIVGLQVGVFLPVNDRKGGLVEAARATVHQLEARLSHLQRDLQLRWTQALNVYLGALEMQLAIENELLPLAEKRYQLAKQAYAEGEIDYLELLTAQRSYLSIQQNALELAERTTLAAVRLTHLVVPERSAGY
jgi:cobalt-zinc-cadmium efflux system outer membrane protein